MAGYWPNNVLGNASNPNLGLFVNQTLQGNHGQQPAFNTQSVINPALAALGNDMNAARAILAASILPNRNAFPATASSATKTTSKIELPPSLLRRKGVVSEERPSHNDCASNTMASSSSSSILDGSRQSVVGSSSSAANNPCATDNSVGVGCTKGTNDAQPVDSVQTASTSTPVFCTEIGMGKEIPKHLNLDEGKIILDPLNSKKQLIPHGAHRILHDTDYYHKFTVSGGAKLTKEKVLKRLLEASEPLLLLPVLYREEGEDTVFYARNCGACIERLCRNNHLVFELDGTKFGVSIHLQYAPIYKVRVNVLSVLRRILEKRWNQEKRYLDLSDFQHDPDLETYFYCPLSQPAVLNYVLQAGSINYLSQCASLCLSRNGLRQLKFEAFSKASYLRTLDVSQNELLYQNDLKDLKELRQVTSLILDGNPLCAEFKTPEEYISTLKSLMPQLKSLDNVPLFSGNITVAKEKNFLCSRTGHTMVDQFLKHFFDRYDWTDRRCLDGLYHNEALFSLTCIHLPGQSTSDGTKLTWYTGYNRNLIKLSDYSKADKLLYHGPAEILDLLCSLPASEHDPYSFCTDLISYNDKMALLAVTGVFREHPTLPPDPDHMRAFRRVFVLSSVSPNEWQITNEQLHISNATTQQAECSFKIKRPPIEAPVAAWLVRDALLLSQEEKDQMASMMMQLTTLNKEWATRFLKESHWYVREALIAFVNQYEAKSLPDEAFVNM